MAADLRDAAAEAARLALKISSRAANAIWFAANLADELPLISPALKTLESLREKVDTAKSNREGLKELHERCAYVTACIVVKCRRNPNSNIDVTPLNDCLEEVEGVVRRCGGRSKVKGVMKASSDKHNISALNTRVDRLAWTLGLAGIAVVEGKADDIKAMLVSVSSRLPSSPSGRSPG